MLPRRPAGTAELPAATAPPLAVVPVVSLLTVGPSWSLAARHGSLVYPVFDLVMLAAAAVAAMVARYRRAPTAAMRRAVR